MQRYLSAEAVARGTLRVAHPYPEGAAAEWIAGCAARLAEDHSVSFSILEQDGGGLVGEVSLRFDWAHHRAVLGYWFGVPFWNRGYATEAVRAMIGYGFDEIGLHRIEASYFAYNPASGRVMEKAGMRYEGRYRDDAWRDGVPHDTIQYAILESDPRPKD